jgi:hypothetical protein
LPQKAKLNRFRCNFVQIAPGFCGGWPEAWLHLDWISTSFHRQKLFSTGIPLKTCPGLLLSTRPKVDIFNTQVCDVRLERGARKSTRSVREICWLNLR